MSHAWPARLGGYDVVRPLSVGGMGAVLLAHKSAHGFEKRVAIKVVLPHLLGDDDAQALFADEAKLAARFAHPNLVPTFDFGKDEGLFYLVMELVEGPSFLDIVRNKNAPLQPPFAARLVADAARGLAWAHALCDDEGVPLRVVHRDISHDNLHLSIAGVVKVLDFGIANSRSRSHATTVGLVRGKPGYMSPERARGEPVDDRTDTWSLGVVAHELLSGERLFQGKGPALLDLVISGPIAALQGVPRPLSTLVTRMLSRELSMRPRMAEVVETLDAYLLDAGVAQTPASLLALADTNVPGIMQRRRAAVADDREANSSSASLSPLGRPDDVATADIATVGAGGPIDDVAGIKGAAAGTVAQTAVLVRPTTDRTHTITLSEQGSRRGPLLAAAAAVGVVAIIGAGVAMAFLKPAPAATTATTTTIPTTTTTTTPTATATTPTAATTAAATNTLSPSPPAPGADDDSAAVEDADAPPDPAVAVIADAADVADVADADKRRRRRRRVTPDATEAKSVAAPAGLVVPDRTPYVDVYVDGAKVGVSPLGSARRPFALKAGRHTVRLIEAGSDAVVVDRVIEAESGATVTVR